MSDLVWSGSKTNRNVRQVIAWHLAREATHQACADAKAFEKLIGSSSVAEEEEQLNSSADVTTLASLEDSDNEGNSGRTKKASSTGLEFTRQFRHSYLIALIGLLNLRNFSSTFHLLQIWGGFLILLPFSLTLLFVGWPLMSLEIAVGNIVGGGIVRSFETVTSAARVVPIGALIATLIFETRLLVDLTHFIANLVEYWSDQPGWIPPLAVRVDCEQTKPNALSCSAKNGCVLYDKVCTYDPLYWAIQHARANVKLTLSTMWAFTLTFLIVIFCIQVALSVGLLGITLLIYFSIQLNLEVFSSRKQEDIHFSITGAECLSSPVMWYETAISTLSLLGVGRGFNQFLGAASPLGTNAVKISGVVCLCVLLVMIIVSSVGYSMLQSVSIRALLHISQVSSRLYQSMGNTMRPRYDLFGVFLPVAIGNVTHKRYIGSILLLTVAASSIAAHTVFFFIILKTVEAAPFVQRHPLKTAIAYGVTLAAVILVLGLCLYSVELDELMSGTSVHLIWISTALFECLVWGWIHHIEFQVDRIGKFATYGWMFVYNVFCTALFVSITPMLSSLTASQTSSSAVQSLIYKILPLVIGLGIYVVSLVIMMCVIFKSARVHHRAIRRRNSTTKHGEAIAKRHSVWWLLLGNIEVFRHALNSLNQRDLLNMSPIHCSLDMIWSIAIKYYIPMILLFLLYHRAEDMDASMSSNALMTKPGLNDFTVTAHDAAAVNVVGTDTTRTVWFYNLAVPPYFLHLLFLVMIVLFSLISLKGKWLLKPLLMKAPPTYLYKFSPRESPRAWSHVKRKYLMEFHDFYGHSGSQSVQGSESARLSTQSSAGEKAQAAKYADQILNRLCSDEDFY